MAHLSPPPSPPSSLPAVTPKLLNYPNIMNGLDKLNFPLNSPALRANLNTALQNKLNQGKSLSSSIDCCRCVDVFYDTYISYNPGF